MSPDLGGPLKDAMAWIVRCSGYGRIRCCPSVDRCLTACPVGSRFWGYHGDRGRCLVHRLGLGGRRSLAGFHGSRWPSTGSVGFGEKRWPATWKMGLPAMATLGKPLEGTLPD
ncbi:hypothetical protein ACLOJK_009240 [Asimina triloba]